MNNPNFFAGPSANNQNLYESMLRQDDLSDDLMQDGAFRFNLNPQP